MVYFTCGSCGQSVKKNKVEGHLSQCRSCQYLSCIDCGKDFRGNDYKSHNKCMSEMEKYGGKVTVNKGELKQGQWIDQVRAAASQANVPPNISRILNNILSFDNIPRKQSKFKNFLRTSANVRDDRVAEQVWKVLETAIKKDVPQQNKPKPQNENKEITNGSSAQDENKEESSETKDKKLSKREKKEERRKEKMKVEKKDARESEKKDGDDETSGHKEKKHKKAKFVENGDEQMDVVENGKSNEKGNKKKKSKMDENEENVDESVNNGLDDSVNGVETKKKKKDKKHNGEVENEEVEVENGEETKKKKKDKKHKGDIENMEVEDSQAERKKKKEKKDAVNGEEGGHNQKKRKREEDESANESVTEGASPIVKKFKFDIAVKNLLMQAPDHQLPLKRIRKKVFAEYGAFAEQKGRMYAQENVWQRLDKKLAKNPLFKVHKEKVTLRLK